MEPPAVIHSPSTHQQKKMPRQQLTKGMEHLRDFVIIPDQPCNSPCDSSSLDPTQASSHAQCNTESDAYGVPASMQPIREPISDSANNFQKRRDPFAFGTRFLEDGDDIYSHNAWDHVETDDTYKAFVAEQAERQRADPVTEADKTKYTDRPERYWNKFYGNNKANFFKDRKWLVSEFPILEQVTRADHGKATILEIGAGAGNTVFPILKMNENPLLRVHACDYSQKAVDVMRCSDMYDTNFMQADVWDLAGETLPPDIQRSTVDVAIMIFVFSALAPAQWKRALSNVWTVLKPGGIVLFRDYGRGDLAQVRFKKGRYLEENFYIRGDGTRVYFFEKDELEQIWTGGISVGSVGSVGSDGSHGSDGSDGLSADMADTSLQDKQDGQKRAAFEVVNLGVDRRMLVNRQRKLKMYRCWMQGLFRKPKEV